LSRLAIAAKSLKGKHVRVLTPFKRTDHSAAFQVNEIVVVTGMYRRGIHVRTEDGSRTAYHVPVHCFELAE